jgi:hypothetical protein
MFQRSSLLLALSFLPTLALAQATSPSTADPETIRGLIAGYGHKARITTEPGGDPIIDARSGDIKYTVYFMNCQEGRDCYDLQLQSSFDVDQPLTPEWANEWNKAWAFGRAWVDENGDPSLSLTIHSAGGLSPADLENTLALWDSVLGGFIQDIGW